MSDGASIPSKYLWSAEEIADAIGEHRNDADWNPQKLTGGGYVVKTLEGRLVPAPITTGKEKQ